MPRSKAATDDLAALSLVLHGEPMRGEMQAILAQLGALRLLRILHWFGEIDLPDVRRVLSQLLRDDGSGAGKALRSAIDALTRRTRLAQIFEPARVAELAAACKLAFEETA